MAVEAIHFVDRYSLIARVMPVALVLLPAVAGGASWLSDAPALAHLTALLGVPGIFAVVLAHLGRDLGKRLEPALWASWGGPPVVRRMRHGSNLLDHHARVRLANQLAALHPPLILPSAAEEHSDPATADRTYEAIRAWMIAKTRDRSAFPLIFAENINYGFRRNCLGLRWFGVAASLLGSASYALVLVRAVRTPPVEPVLWAYATVCLAAALWWSAIVRPDWVRLPADAYAARLLEAADQFSVQDPGR